MKEIEIKNSEPTEFHSQSFAKTEKKIATRKIHKGHLVFMMNLKSGVIGRAKEEETTVDYVDWKNKHAQKKKKVLIDNEHLYCTALNKKNAAKKFAKMIHSIGRRKISNH